MSLSRISNIILSMITSVHQASILQTRCIIIKFGAGKFLSPTSKGIYLEITEIINIIKERKTGL